jgi:hypothetical protein
LHAKPDSLIELSKETDRVKAEHCKAGYKALSLFGS